MLDKYLEVAIRAVRKSGVVLTEYHDKLHDFRMKNSNLRDLVTEVDILSEKSIKKVIWESFPDHSIVAEEGAADQRDPALVWHVDPLDGTVNYSQGIPLCAVSVGLEENGRMQACAIYNPFAEELFFATRGRGSFLNGAPIHVSGKDSFQNGLYVGAFSSSASANRDKEYMAFGAVNNRSRGALRIGSAAVALAYLACGRIDGFWARGLFSWDLAAGILLVQEAGGQVSGADGRDFTFDQPLLIASNGGVHAELSGVLAETLAE